MSRLEELITELCPDGVKYDTLDSCTRKTYNIKWKNEKKSFQYIDLSSVDRDTHEIIKTIEIDSTTAPSRAQQIIEDGDILFGSTRPLLNRYCQINKNYHNQICSTGFCVLRPDIKKVNIRWIYHFLSSSSFIDHVKTYQQGASYPAITDSDIKKYKIPVPPLPIQEEIVRILDNFTELIKRKEQRQYYINNLFQFNDDCVEWKSLGEIGSFIRGKRFTKNDYVEDGISVIHYGEIYTNYGTSADNTLSKVRREMAGILRYASPNDVIFTDVGETVEDVGKAVAWLGDKKVAIHDHCYALKHSMNPKFISYYMQTDSFISEKIKYVVRTKVKTLLIDGFAKIKIPIPYPDNLEKSLNEQARIVSILDRFDALCNDLTSGLPAEIEARKKQYEYYRDKLLTFRAAGQ